MKKICIILFIFLFGILTSKVMIVNAHQGEEKYEVNAPNMTNEELQEYYIKNGIFPANAPQDSGKILTENKVSDHLSSRISGYTNWVKTASTFSVADVYGKNPVETNEYDALTQKAKTN